MIIDFGHNWTNGDYPKVKYILRLILLLALNFVVYEIYKTPQRNLMFGVAWFILYTKFDSGVCVRRVRRWLLRHGGISGRVFRGRGNHHEKSVVRTAQDRAMCRDRSRIHRLFHRRAAGCWPTMLRQTSLRDTRPGRRVREHEALSQGTQNLSGSQLRMRSRYCLCLWLKINLKGCLNEAQLEINLWHLSPKHRETFGFIIFRVVVDMGIHG